MPILYNIDPKLNLIIYVCYGITTPTEFFKTADEASLDTRLHDDIKVIIDFLSVELDLSPSDLKLALEKKKQMEQGGRKLEKAAVITTSSSLKLLADALQLMASNSYSLGIYHNMRDALRWLGFSTIQEEIIQVWEGLKAESLKKLSEH